jgi:hypothetical protein
MLVSNDPELLTFMAYNMFRSNGLMFYENHYSTKCDKDILVELISYNPTLCYEVIYNEASKMNSKQRAMLINNIQLGWQLENIIKQRGKAFGEAEWTVIINKVMEQYQWLTEVVVMTLGSKHDIAKKVERLKLKSAFKDELIKVAMMQKLSK